MTITTAVVISDHICGTEESALGDRDALKYSPDGSLDIYIQKASPGADKESNRLPADEGTLGGHNAIVRAQSAGHRREMGATCSYADG